MKKIQRLDRCSICNKVSDKQIETEVGDLVKGHFHPDPKFKDTSVICSECDDVIGMQKSEYHLYDEPIWNFPF